jgi:hypothetical protein
MTALSNWRRPQGDAALLQDVVAVSHDPPLARRHH